MLTALFVLAAWGTAAYELYAGRIQVALLLFTWAEVVAINSRLTKMDIRLNG